MDYSSLTREDLIFMMERQTWPRISGPSDLERYLSPYAAKPVEYFLVLTANAALKIINCHEISKGTVNRTLVTPRDVFRAAILDNAASIFVSHVHPSGELVPSREDLLVTKKLVEAGEIIGIPVLDHVIIGNGFYSMRSNGDF